MLFNDEIVSIEYIGDSTELIDIELDGDRLFYANKILTHNSGSVDSDAGMESTSDSFGIAMTADLMLALISTEELVELNQVIVKQLKNRFSDPSQNKKFVVGIDKSKMRLYDVENSAQLTRSDKEDDSVFGASKFGGRLADETASRFRGKTGGFQ